MNFEDYAKKSRLVRKLFRGIEYFEIGKGHIGVFLAPLSEYTIISGGLIAAIKFPVMALKVIGAGIIAFSIITLIGRFFKKIGLHDLRTKVDAELNPITKEILERLRNIEKKLK